MPDAALVEAFEPVPDRNGEQCSPGDPRLIGDQFHFLIEGIVVRNGLDDAVLADGFGDSAYFIAMCKSTGNRTAVRQHMLGVPVGGEAKRFGRGADPA